MAVTSTQAVVCTAVCGGAAALKRDPLSFAACWAQCMGVDRPEITTACDDLAKIRDCWKRNRKRRPAEPYIVYKCTFWAGNTYEVFDKNPDPPGGGWKLCGGELYQR